MGEAPAPVCARMQRHEGPLSSAHSPLPGLGGLASYRFFRRLGLRDGYDATQPAGYSTDPATAPAAAAGTWAARDPVAGAAA